MRSEGDDVRYSFVMGVFMIAWAGGAFAADTVFNVRDFGAAGDGKTADTAAIQKAIDAAANVNGTVWFPAGVYRCHALKVKPYVTLKADPVWIYHCEKVGAVLELDSEDADCLLDVSRAYAARIRGLVLAGIKRPVNKKEIHGIYMNHDKTSPKEDTITIDDVKVMNFSGNGIWLKRVWVFIVRRSHMMSNALNGIQVQGWDGFVTDNQLSANGIHGFASQGGCATVMFTANRVEWNGKCGLWLSGGDTWNITGNSFDCNGSEGMLLDSIHNSTVTGNIFRRSGRLNPAVPHYSLEGCSGLSVCGNAAKSGWNADRGGSGMRVPEYGLKVKKLTDTVITGNAFGYGFTKQFLLDEGGHGTNFVFTANPASAAPPASR